MPLLKLSDFTVPSMLDEQVSVAQRSLERMKTSAAPMPPSQAPAVSPSEIAVFERWVNAGLPAGECATDPDAGLPLDGGGPMLTCQTNQFREKPTTSNPHASPQMAPGQACIACHKGENFFGQNPGGALQRQDLVYEVMGTVFTAMHEQDFCVSTAGQGGTVVEILDSTGAVALQLEVNETGNFFGSTDAGLKLPYRARVVRGGKTRAMSTTQTSGDCNTCHTELGREAAPGRVLVP